METRSAPTLHSSTKSARPVKSSRVLTPVIGSCRWLLQPGLAGSPGFLSITVRIAGGTKEVSEVYAITSHKEGGYRLTKPDGTAYDLSVGPEVWECEYGEQVHPVPMTHEGRLRCVEFTCSL
jgi:hypothetical protein